MRIKYFAWIKNITNIESENLKDSSIIDINSLKQFLCQKYPKLDQYINKDDIIQIAVNFKYVSSNNKLSSTDEIALFPPVSGG